MNLKNSVAKITFFIAYVSSHRWENQLVPEVIWVVLGSTALSYGSRWPCLLAESAAQGSSTWAHSGSQAVGAASTQKKFLWWCRGTRVEVETCKAPKGSKTITSIHIQLAKTNHLIKTKASLCPLQACGWWEERRIEPVKQSAMARHGGERVTQARFQRESSKSKKQKVV